jgi:hypothetical protein
MLLPWLAIELAGVDRKCRYHGCNCIFKIKLANGILADHYIDGLMKLI